MKPKMTDVIAERKLAATIPGSKAAVITVQIGKPAHDPNPWGDGYCPIRINDLQKNFAEVSANSESPAKTRRRCSKAMRKTKR